VHSWRNLSSVTTMAERLQAAQIKIESARDAVEEDDGASPVLTAVVNEFARKAEKAAGSPDERVAVVELEQAGDSAKVAVEADLGVSPATRDAVFEAHPVICIVKGKLDL
jgi:type IV secretory pathway VirJ component